jgi:hypothetical protein
LISLITIIGGRRCNNIRSLGRKKSKVNVIATVAVTVIVIITTIKTATIVKAYSLLSNTSCLALLRIVP